MSDQQNENTQPILPPDANAAMATQDTIGFSNVQIEKSKAVQQYQQAAQEFQTRANAFRRLGKDKLDELETLQLDIKQKTEASQDIMQGMIEKFKKRTVTQKGDKVDG